MSQTANQTSDRRKSARTGTDDRRKARPLRDHVQAIFDALRDELAKEEDHARLVIGLKSWQKLEDVMLDCPALVPLVLEMSWRKRNTPAFSPLLTTTSGAVATDKNQPLAPSGASYNELLMASLGGAVRITCLRRQNEWLAAERGKGTTLLGYLMHAFGVMEFPSNAALLKKYSRAGLYDVLKPHLVDLAQFDAVESYAMLSTRAAELLGPRLRGMTAPAVVKTFAGLDAEASKFAVALADAYAAATAEAAAEHDDELASRPEPEHAAGEALVELLEGGTGLLKNAMAERKGALAVLRKMSGPLGKDVWNVLSHAGNIKNISHCSGPIAAGFGVLAAEMDDAVAKVLGGINDDKVARYFAAQLLEISGPDKIRSWIIDTTDLAVWKSVVMDLNKDLRRPIPSPDLSDGEKETIRRICEDMQQKCTPLQATQDVAADDESDEEARKAALADVPQEDAGGVDPPAPPISGAFQQTPSELEWGEFVQTARKKTGLS